MARPMDEQPYEAPPMATRFIALHASNFPFRVKEVMWEGKNIRVLDTVTITPPYTVETCKTRNQDTRPLDHVRKLVSRNPFEEKNW